LLIYLLYVIFFISCIVLVAAVLLQPGKTDAGALFTSNVSSAAFGPRGTATVLSKITIVAAAVFMLSALLISMPALTGNSSVLQSNPASVTEEAPGSTTAETPNANSPAANVDANAAPVNAADSNAPANK
jgi:preprotein translocase subunit SecG